MDILITRFARSLIWPLRVRLSLVAAFFIVGVLLYELAFPMSGGPLVITIIAAAWFFGFRGMFLMLVLSNVVAIALSYLLFGIIFSPSTSWLFYIAGIASGILVGLVVSTLRTMVNMLVAAQHKLLQAEQLKVQAYEQRLAAVQAQQQMTIAYQRQQQVNQLKDEFLLSLNHELRTPLTTIQGYLEMLRQQRASADPATQERFVRTALESCHDLGHLINTLLDASRLSNGLEPPQLEACALYEVVRELIAHLDPRENPEQRVQLDIAEHITVWADKQYLGQILGNLLSNAFKYAPATTPIIVFATLRERSTEANAKALEVCIGVKDQGPGISPDEAPLLFERFVRLKRDMLGTRPGTGLGLFICKQLVAMMDGHIWVESTGKAGEGSCFYFTLPAPAGASQSSL